MKNEIRGPFGVPKNPIQPEETGCILVVKNEDGTGYWSGGSITENKSEATVFDSGSAISLSGRLEMQSAEFAHVYPEHQNPL